MSMLQRLCGRETAKDNLRIIITRHGECADSAIGPNWLDIMEKNGGYDYRISYLTPRIDFQEWNYDPPLTVNGEQQSMSVGRKLLQLGYPIDYCYSSPAYRSIQTANKILESQQNISVPINIEPGLFECPSWYNGEFSFIPSECIERDRRFNINPYYTPIYGNINIRENEKRYYKRSRILINSIVKKHKKHGGTILLSGHTGSFEAITHAMLRRRCARPPLLQLKADKIDYCHCVILECDARTHQWSVHLPTNIDNPHDGQQSIQSSIPLYSPTSQPISSNYSPDTSLFTDNLSYKYTSYYC